MTCKECGERLVDYHFSELQPQVRSEVAAHLASCNRCAKQYCRLHEDLSGASRLREETPGPRIHAALRQKVQKAFPEPWWQKVLRASRRGIPAYQTALAVVVALLVWFVIGRWSGTPGESSSTSRKGTIARTTDAAGRATREVCNDYDAADIVSLDPRAL